jgi:hypothetical protein
MGTSSVFSSRLFAGLKASEISRLDRPVLEEVKSYLRGIQQPWPMFVEERDITKLINGNDKKGIDDVVGFPIKNVLYMDAPGNVVNTRYVPVKDKGDERLYWSREVRLSNSISDNIQKFVRAPSLDLMNIIDIYSFELKERSPLEIKIKLTAPEDIVYFLDYFTEGIPYHGVPEKYDSEPRLLVQGGPNLGEWYAAYRKPGEWDTLQGLASSEFLDKDYLWWEYDGVAKTDSVLVGLENWGKTKGNRAKGQKVVTDNGFTDLSSLKNISVSIAPNGPIRGSTTGSFGYSELDFYDSIDVSIKVGSLPAGKYAFGFAPHNRTMDDSYTRSSDPLAYFLPPSGKGMIKNIDYAHGPYSYNMTISDAPVLIFKDGVTGVEYFKESDRDLIVDVLSKIKQPSATVTDVVRSYLDQAKAMYENYWSATSYKNKHGSYSGTRAGYQSAIDQYGAAGDKVTNYIKSKYMTSNGTWVPASQFAVSKWGIISDAADYIKLISEDKKSPVTVSNHILKPGATLYAVDIAPSSISKSLQPAFKDGIKELVASGQIEQFLYPGDGIGKENAFHIVFSL